MTTAVMPSAQAPKPNLNGQVDQIDELEYQRGLYICAKPLHELGANITLIGRGDKKPIHKWKQWQNKPQTLQEFRTLPWTGYKDVVAVGIGVINGSGGIRFFDLDAHKDETAVAIPEEMVDKVLVAMGLPTEYEWVYQSGSGKGWGIMFRCWEDVPADTLTVSDKEPGVYWGYPLEHGPLHHLELRYSTGQTIVPPSEHESGKAYIWRWGNPSGELATVPMDVVLRGFFAIARPRGRKTVSAEKTNSKSQTTTDEDDVREEIRQKFDLVEYAEANISSETQEESNGEIRILGNGGLLIDPDKQIWNCFADGKNGQAFNGDCFDLVGWHLHGETWFTNRKRYWGEVLQEAADFVGVILPIADNNNDDDLEQSAPAQNGWQIRTLADAFQERPPIDYIVDGLFSTASLSIVYGAPGTLKSMLLADLCAAVASGQQWLTFPDNTKGLSTRKSSILWLDVDNGVRRSDERFEAVARARKLPTNAPIHYIVLPNPPFNAGERDSIVRLEHYIIECEAKLLIIDNLSRINGRVNENDSQMSAVMGYLRKLAEDLNIAIILIHHQRKSSNNVIGRAGDSLRGHSSIEASIDLALLVTRNNQEDEIAIMPTKVRGAAVKPLYASFEFEHKADSTDLLTARFWQREGNDTSSLIAIKQAILESLSDGEKVNQGELVEVVQDYGITTGKKKIRNLIKEMAQNGEIAVSKGGNNAFLYSLSKEFGGLA